MHYSKILTILFVIIPLFLSAQTGDEKEKTPKKMLMEVIVTDYEKNPKQGEKIIFIDTVSKEQYSGITGEQGKFTIGLPGGTTYQAKIKGVGSEKSYEVFSIPKLQENRNYGKSQFIIQYEPPRVFTLDEVYFDVNKASLRRQSYAELNELVDFMKRKKNIRIEIAGHTDSTGEEEDNMKLSQRRADRVKQYLVKKGIDANRIEAKGYGENQPVADNSTKTGRQKNRRTEVRIIGKGEIKK
jgi:outer membrane protein OmpA-like peptidoglycan-associated protein